MNHERRVVGVRRVGRIAAVLGSLLALLIALVATINVAASPAASAATVGSWTPTGNMTAARTQATATLLPNGEVLEAGGNSTSANSPMLASAELYNPATGTWQLTGSMAAARTEATATLLPDGEVLEVGGNSFSGPMPNPSLASAELYNPATGTWQLTGSMTDGRADATATLLQNGEVLEAGGSNASGVPLASAELYNPTTGTWQVTGSMTAARTGATATLLQNGEVLEAGGSNASGVGLASAELYNPTTGTWQGTGNMLYEHDEATASLLADGDVLVAGGLINSTNTADQPIAFGEPNADLYNPSSGTWTSAGAMTASRYDAAAVVLESGSVLVTGGTVGDGGSLAEDVNGVTAIPMQYTTDIYNPATNAWAAGPTMAQARENQTTTLLSNGTVLVAGGDGPDDGYTPLDSAELYDPNGNASGPQAELTYPHRAVGHRDRGNLGESNRDRHQHGVGPADHQFGHDQLGRLHRQSGGLYNHQSRYELRHRSHVRTPDRHPAERDLRKLGHADHPRERPLRPARGSAQRNG